VNLLSDTIKCFSACAILGQDNCVVITNLNVKDFQILVVKPFEENWVSELSRRKTVCSVAFGLRNEIINFFAPDPKLILITDSPSLVSDSNNVLKVAAFRQGKLMPLATFSSFSILVSNSK
jgi:hypothetical protein